MTEPLTPDQIAAAMNAQQEQAAIVEPIDITLEVQQVATGKIDGLTAIRVTVPPGLVAVTFKLPDPIRRKLRDALGDVITP